MDQALEAVLGELMILHRQMARENGLTMVQLMVLKTIALGGPQKPSHIADKFGISRPAVSSEINSLESAGWVRRTPEPGDRRSLRASLTPKGARTMTRMNLQRQAQLKNVIRGLTPLQAGQLADWLTTVANRLHNVLAEDAGNPDGEQ